MNETLLDVAPHQPHRDHPKNGIGSLIGAGIGAGLLVLVLAIAALAVVVPFATGSQGYNITTDSMRPAYPPGTLVIVQPVAPEEIRLGDVITYQIKPNDPTVITHRVIANTLSTNGNRSFTAMGDNNATADPEAVTEQQIQGRVWYSLPWLGTLSDLKQEGVFGIVIPLLGLALILYAGFLVLSWVIGKARRV